MATKTLRTKELPTRRVLGKSTVPSLAINAESLPSFFGQVATP
jgi:hypothetical protein